MNLQMIFLCALLFGFWFPVLFLKLFWKYKQIPLHFEIQLALCREANKHLKYKHLVSKAVVKS